MGCRPAPPPRAAQVSGLRLRPLPLPCPCGRSLSPAGARGPRRLSWFAAPGVPAARAPSGPSGFAARRSWRPPARLVCFCPHRVLRWPLPLAPAPARRPFPLRLLAPAPFPRLPPSSSPGCPSLRRPVPVCSGPSPFRPARAFLAGRAALLAPLPWPPAVVPGAAPPAPRRGPAARGAPHPPLALARWPLAALFPPPRRPSVALARRAVPSWSAARRSPRRPPLRALHRRACPAVVVPAFLPPVSALPGPPPVAAGSAPRLACVSAGPPSPWPPALSLRWPSYLSPWAACPPCPLGRPFSSPGCVGCPMPLAVPFSAVPRRPPCCFFAPFFRAVGAALLPPLFALPAAAVSPDISARPSGACSPPVPVSPFLGGSVLPAPFSRACFARAASPTSLLRSPALLSPTRPRAAVPRLLLGLFLLPLLAAGRLSCCVATASFRRSFQFAPACFSPALFSRLRPPRRPYRPPPRASPHGLSCFRPGLPGRVAPSLRLSFSIAPLPAALLCRASSLAAGALRAPLLAARLFPAFLALFVAPFAPSLPSLPRPAAAGALFRCRLGCRAPSSPVCVGLSARLTVVRPSALAGGPAPGVSSPPAVLSPGRVVFCPSAVLVVPPISSARAAGPPGGRRPAVLSGLFCLLLGVGLLARVGARLRSRRGVALRAALVRAAAALFSLPSTACAPAHFAVAAGGLRRRAALAGRPALLPARGRLRLRPVGLVPGCRPALPPSRSLPCVPLSRACLASFLLRGLLFGAVLPRLSPRLVVFPCSPVGGPAWMPGRFAPSPLPPRLPFSPGPSPPIPRRSARPSRSLRRLASVLVVVLACRGWPPLLPLAAGLLAGWSGWAWAGRRLRPSGLPFCLSRCAHRLGPRASLRRSRRFRPVPAPPIPPLLAPRRAPGFGWLSAGAPPARPPRLPRSLLPPLWVASWSRSRCHRGLPPRAVPWAAPPSVPRVGPRPWRAGRASGAPTSGSLPRSPSRLGPRPGRVPRVCTRPPPVAPFWLLGACARPAAGSRLGFPPPARRSCRVCLPPRRCGPCPFRFRPGAPWLLCPPGPSPPCLPPGTVAPRSCAPWVRCPRVRLAAPRRLRVPCAPRPCPAPCGSLAAAFPLLSPRPPLPRLLPGGLACRPGVPLWRGCGCGSRARALWSGCVPRPCPAPSLCAPRSPQLLRLLFPASCRVAAPLLAGLALCRLWLRSAGVFLRRLSCAPCGVAPCCAGCRRGCLSCAALSGPSALWAPGRWRRSLPARTRKPPSGSASRLGRPSPLAHHRPAVAGPRACASSRPRPLASPVQLTLVAAVAPAVPSRPARSALSPRAGARVVCPARCARSGSASLAGPRGGRPLCPSARWRPPGPPGAAPLPGGAACAVGGCCAAALVRRCRRRPFGLSGRSGPVPLLVPHGPRGPAPSVLLHPLCARPLPPAPVRALSLAACGFCPCCPLSAACPRPSACTPSPSWLRPRARPRCSRVPLRAPGATPLFLGAPLSAACAARLPGPCGPAGRVVAACCPAPAPAACSAPPGPPLAGPGRACALPRRRGLPFSFPAVAALRFPPAALIRAVFCPPRPPPSLSPQPVRRAARGCASGVARLLGSRRRCGRAAFAPPVVPGLLRGAAPRPLCTLPPCSPCSRPPAPLPRLALLPVPALPALWRRPLLPPRAAPAVPLCASPLYPALGGCRAPLPALLPAFSPCARCRAPWPPRCCAPARSRPGFSCWPPPTRPPCPRSSPPPLRSGLRW